VDEEHLDARVGDELGDHAYALAREPRLGADDVDRVELVILRLREIPAADADVRAAEILGAIAIVDREELDEDRVVGATSALDGDMRTRTSSCPSSTSLVALKRRRRSSPFTPCGRAISASGTQSCPCGSVRSMPVDRVHAAALFLLRFASRRGAQSTMSR
jgi:hypothetical protein